jgi:hypothetical protein
MRCLDKLANLKKKYAAFLVICMIITALFYKHVEVYAEEFDENTIHKLCSGSEADAIRILKRLSQETTLNKSKLSFELIQNVFLLEMREYRDLLRAMLEKYPDQKRGEYTSMFLSMASNNYKFALCEKIKNPNMPDEAIATNAYLKCRMTIYTKVEQKPPTCF